MSELVYRGDRAAPVRIAPLDPNAALAVTLDIDEWLRGEPLTAQKWTPPAGIVVGDGAVSKTLGTGGSVTPQPPAQFVDPEDGRVKVQATIWVDDAAAEPPAANTDVQIVVSLQTSTRGDDRTVVSRVAER